MKECIIIRSMMEYDIEGISQAFIHQGWPGREDILASYFQDQENGKRDVLVAESDGFVAGYITILPAAKHGPFVGVYPELSDFNVFEPFRNRGIGNQLLEEAEKKSPATIRDCYFRGWFTLGLWSSSKTVCQTGLYPRWIWSLV